ncbi:transposase [Sphingomonas sp. 2R-10]|uniref:transposase n=1 Tax=Sphingomonas sp. 2R-10 TaxID=3045148 RepID=UPI000F76BFFC
MTVAAVEAGVPPLVEARTVVEGFHEMIRRKTEGDIVPWIERGRGSLVASSANGIARDVAAVRVAIVTSWSNGQTEGQIIKLKLVKRQMYGGGN